MINDPICIYHDHCSDGFAAATAVYKALGDNAEYYAANYQEPPPDVEGRDVIMVDFSYKRDVLIEMAQSANHILILDHHKTAKDDLVDMPDNVEVKFDMDRCGAMITWEHFFPEAKIPKFVRYIQDRDLWHWKLPFSKEASAAIMCLEKKFNIWEQYMHSDELVNELINKGRAIVQYQEYIIQGVATSEVPRLDIAGFNVPCVNTTTLISEIGNELAKGEPFAAMYFDTEDKRVFSLRSDENGEDVSQIALQFGGGGHPRAAGFKVDTPFVLCPSNS